MLLGEAPAGTFFMFKATPGHDKPEGLFYKLDGGYWDVAVEEFINVDRSNQDVNVKWLDHYDVAKKYRMSTTWVLALESEIKEAVAKEKSL